jgi:glycosyltransferase involved in cell wall biosynthesis
MMFINRDDDRGENNIEKLPLVSIIVLNWNGEQVIRPSLDSIRRLDYPNIEVIVVDNGSTDRSADIIS